MSKYSEFKDWPAWKDEVERCKAAQAKKYVRARTKTTKALILEKEALELLLKETCKEIRETCPHPLDYLEVHKHQDDERLSIENTLICNLCNRTISRW